MARQSNLVPRSVPGRRLPWCVSLPPKLSETGARERRFFATKAHAKTFIEQTKARVLNLGTATHGLTSTQREVAAAVFGLLGSDQPSHLLDIVREYLERKQQTDRSVTLAHLRDAFTSSKESRSPAYKRQVKAAFAKLSALDEENVAGIEPVEIDNELTHVPAAARNAHLRVVKAAFNFALKKGWTLANPVSRVDFSEIRRGEVELLSNSETKQLLTACKKVDSALLPYHLFGLFAGIRPQELERMGWEQVQLDEKHILLTAEVTKTGTRRVIDIEPTLARWLEWLIKKRAKQTGPVTPTTNLRRRLRAVREAAKIPRWVQDVMRHTYASNWLAVNESVDKLRANLGHRSNDVLWRHYHKAVLRKDAEKFWAIMPTKGKSKVVAFKESAA